ncbi:MAG: lysophospholipid acyltransferase family protein [Muribaculaceae bacterium]|nr:lysophospholipid acyltransferase family protein [Muribaculaceae bacterium]
MESTAQQDGTVKRTVLDYDDIAQMAPFFKGKPRLVNWLMRMLDVDKVNWIHSRNFDTPGPAFCRGLLSDLDIKLRIDNEELLDNLPEGPFVTVSNHPFGALDGITLIDIIGSRRPEYKVMVNMILNHITAMRQNFIAVDQAASDDPSKKAVSMKGIKEAIMQIRHGQPVGFFPAGAVGNYNRHLKFEDREWQPVVIRLIRQFGVPVIPIYFHGLNSWWFRLLGIVSWQLRTLRLPAEVFRRKGSTIHVSVGNLITPEELKAHSGSEEELGLWLRQQTYKLASIK